MKNIVAKAPSTSPNIVIYASHYDSKRLDNFVGANDGGSSTGVLLELARLLCARKNGVAVWLVFLRRRGSLQFQLGRIPTTPTAAEKWLRGSRLSGELHRVKALILVDMVGPTNPLFRRESNSTPWLTELVWSTAARLGYGKIFDNSMNAIEDDHIPFLQRDVPSTDIIDFESPVMEYWHNTKDTLDKVDPRTLAVTGHVLIATVPELEKKFK